MQQQLILQAKTAQSTTKRFNFKVPDIDSLFPGFKPGDFAVIYGAQFVTSLISKLCVRAQLPYTVDGLESKVVFIDAANSSSLENILDAAELQRLDPKTTLGNVISMRAYTAYRLTTLITEKLEKSIEASGAKLVVISDIVCPFLNDNVDDQEARAVYKQIIGYLSSFAKRKRVIVVATYLSHESNRRNSTLQDITTAKANIVLRFSKTPYTSEVELEKHPTYMLGVAEFTPEVKTLTEFAHTSSQTLLQLLK